MYRDQNRNVLKKLSEEIQNIMAAINTTIDSIHDIQPNPRDNSRQCKSCEESFKKLQEPELKIDKLEEFLEEIECVKEWEAESAVVDFVSDVRELKKTGNNEMDRTLNNDGYEYKYRKYMHSLETILSQIEEGDNTNEIKAIMDLYAAAVKAKAKHPDPKIVTRHADALLGQLARVNDVS